MDESGRVVECGSSSCFIKVGCCCCFDAASAAANCDGVADTTFKGGLPFGCSIPPPILSRTEGMEPMDPVSDGAGHTEGTGYVTFATGADCVRGVELSIGLGCGSKTLPLIGAVKSSKPTVLLGSPSTPDVVVEISGAVLKRSLVPLIATFFVAVPVVVVTAEESVGDDPGTVDASVDVDCCLDGTVLLCSPASSTFSSIGDCLLLSPSEEFPTVPCCDSFFLTISVSCTMSVSSFTFCDCMVSSVVLLWCSGVVVVAAAAVVVDGSTTTDEEDSVIFEIEIINMQPILI